jgi:coenzyme F420-reducing hydrogenase delta subunit
MIRLRKEIEEVERKLVNLEQEKTQSTSANATEQLMETIKEMKESLAQLNHTVSITNNE